MQKAKAGRSIILTTHSMEEAEALCQRIGIISHGRLRCIGPTIYLRQRYGSGFKISVSCDNSNKDRVIKYVQEVLPKSELQSSFARTHFFRIKAEDVQLSTFFDAMNKNGGKVGIRDWSINQASLEEVFLKLADN